ncbi:MAG: hypothetical protein QOJ44_1787 [Acidimicrobiaceae bacterium]|jgi:hypothetical protein|nr:hypothetical protein [Acidimicrobiaceae bacterium]
MTIGPHVDQLARDLIEDLGLVNDYVTGTDDPVALRRHLLANRHGGAA